MPGRPCFLHRFSGTACRTAYLDAVLLLVVLFIASSYWIVSGERRPAEPTAVTAIYRAGDIEYYPFVAGLSRLQLTEAVVREHAGEGVVRFLVWSSLPHALCFGLFGPVGFLVMDLVGFVAFYVACVRMLRQVAVTELLAKAATLLILGGAMPYLLDLLGSLPTAHQHQISLEFWGLRIPRPFVSSIPLCLCVAMFFHLLLKGSRGFRGWSWAAFGACLAVLLQADPYQAGALAISTPILVLTRLSAGAGTIRALVRNVTIGVVTFGLFAAPFIVQWACGTADGSRRLGEFPVERSHPLWLPYPNFTYLRLAWIAAVCAAGVSLRTERSRERAWVFLGLTALCTASYLALPLTCLVFGKAVQVYHFTIAFHAWVFLTLAVVSLHGLHVLAGAFRRLAAWAGAGATLPRVVVTTLVAAVIAACMVTTLGRASHLAGKTGHMRSDFPEWRNLGAVYRRDFAELVEELSRSEYADNEVVGTFDHQVYAWWATFRGGRSFLPDAALSTLTDSAMEDRLIALCHCIGMDHSRFEEFIHRRYVGVFWLGHAKYQASSAHAFAAESDYTPEQQRQISKTGMAGTWNSLIPLSETARLLRKFDEDASAPLPGRLDLVILTKDESMQGLRPSDADFRAVYSNDTFGVWQRREHR